MSEIGAKYYPIYTYMNDLTLVDEAYEIFAANFNFILDPLEPNKTLKFVILKSILVRYLFGKNST